MANEEHLAILKQGAVAWNQWRKRNLDIRPNLSEADLSGADLIGANLIEADLSGAHLGRAKLGEADLSGADLSGADLIGANLFRANLGEANLSGANVESASVGYTTFGNVDLSEVKGLETVRHYFRSTIGIDTIYESKGKIPEVFLRGCGVPDNFIAYIGSLVGKAFEYYSCFISYWSLEFALPIRHI